MAGYICEYLCIAEIISVLPFSGGSFAFTRITLSPYLGLVSGYGECCEYIAQLATEMWLIPTMLASVFHGFDTKYESVLSVGIYLIFLTHNWVRNDLFHPIYFVFVFYVIVILLVYLFANAHLMDFQKNVTEQDAYHSEPDTVYKFFHALPYVTVFYVGLDCMPLWCKDTPRAANTVPRAMMTAILIIAAASLIFIVATPALEPGIGKTRNTWFPLLTGLMNAFNVDDKMGSVMAVPAVLGHVVCNFFALIKLLSALMRSRVIMTPLERLFPNDASFERSATIVAAVSAFAVYFGVWYGAIDYTKSIYHLALFGNVITAECCFLNFIIFRWKFGSLKRNFTNPFGVAGAVFGMLVFGLIGFSIVAMQNDDHFVLYFHLIALGAVSIFYFAIFRHHQIYSPEESAVLFLAYIMKANAYNRSRIRMKHTKLIKAKEDEGSQRRAAAAAARARAVEMSVTAVADWKKDAAMAVKSSAGGGEVSLQRTQYQLKPMNVTSTADILEPRRPANHNDGSKTPRSHRTSRIAGGDDGLANNIIMAGITNMFNVEDLLPEDQLIANFEQNFAPKLRRNQQNHSGDLFPHHRVVPMQETSTPEPVAGNSAQGGSGEDSAAESEIDYDDLLDTIFNSNTASSVSLFSMSYDNNGSRQVQLTDDQQD